MDDHGQQQLRVELNALFDERERVQQTAAPIAERADHQRRLTEFFQRLVRHLNECSDIQAGPPKKS
jgi:hypothetical protein